MKKVTSVFMLFSLLLIANYSFSQAVSLPKFASTPSTASDKNFCDWYKPNAWLYHATGGMHLPDSIAFLMPDTLAQIINVNDSITRNYHIAIGQVIDPKDPYIDISDNPGIRLNKFYSYYVDSFVLNYVYVRNVDSAIHPITNLYSKVVDTLEVYYLAHQNGLTPSKTMDTGTNKWSWRKPSWSSTALAPVKFLAMEKFVITDADSTSVSNVNGGFENKWNTKTMVKMSNKKMIISEGDYNYVGMLFKFKPGMSYNDSSVMIYQKHSDSLRFTNKRVNYFGLSYLNNTSPSENQWRSNNYFTHSLFSNNYYDSTNSNSEAFFPGNSHTLGKHLNLGALLCAGYAGIAEKRLIANVSIFPNTTNGDATLLLNLLQASKVQIHITNTFGQQLQNMHTEKLSVGQHNLMLCLNQFKNGIYIVNIIVNEQVISKKLLINR